MTDSSPRVRGRLYRGYRLVNHGYYPPDRCVWWEAHNLQTGEADFRATTRRHLKAEIDRDLKVLDKNSDVC